MINTFAVVYVLLTSVVGIVCQEECDLFTHSECLSVNKGLVLVFEGGTGLSPLFFGMRKGDDDGRAIETVAEYISVG